MKAVQLFNKWADIGKDNGMEINHGPSVSHMLDLIPLHILESKFNFLDIGCGNGWVVKKMSSFQHCFRSVGIDGAEKMIKKAILKDSKSEYLVLDINDLNNFHKTFDVVFSMEVFYYLKEPTTIMTYIFDNLLSPGGFLVMGVDHYSENLTSLSWPQDLNVHMHTYSILQWEKIIKDAGFSNVNLSQFGKKKDWEGTLIISGNKD